MSTTTETRALHEIAAEVRQDWGNIHYAAAPYLDAMSSLTSVDQSYGADDARSIVRYFLSNATSWRGDTARRVKAELRTMVGK